jgi:CspA family cold shock protein
MVDGVIKSIAFDKQTRARKGFGFIQPAGGGEQVFFHKSAVKNCSFDDCAEGDAVEFEPGMGDKGPRTERVMLKD